MKTKVVYIAIGAFLMVSMATLWGFKSKSDAGVNSYAVADFYYSKSLLDNQKKVNISFSEGPAEELKYEPNATAPEVMVQLVTKIELRGYTFDHSEMTSVNNMLYNRLVFKKK